MEPTSCTCGNRALRRVGDTGALFPRCYTVLQCLRCGLRFPEQLPSVEEIEIRYNDYGQYTNPERLKADLERRKDSARRLVNKLTRAGGNPPTGRFLELGCANGALVYQVSEQSSLDCYGLELDPASAAHAETLLPGKIFSGPLEKAGYAATSFDFVYAEEVVEHLTSPARFFREVYRIVKPGGLFLLSTPNFGGISSRTMGMEWKEFAPDEHIHMFSPRSLRRLLADAGFQGIQVATGGFSFKRRRDRRDLFPFSRAGILVRLASRTLGKFGLGDGLSARATK